MTREQALALVRRALVAAFGEAVAEEALDALAMAAGVGDEAPAPGPDRMPLWALWQSLLVSAFEGGSGYWARVPREGRVRPPAPIRPMWGNETWDVDEWSRYTYPVTSGGSIIVREEGGDHVLDLAALRGGWDLLATSDDFRHVWGRIQAQGAGVDASDADVFLQLAVLQDVVYG